MNGWKSFIGLAGVAPHEKASARLWASRFEIPMILVALCIPVAWYMDVKGTMPPIAAAVFDWIIWLVFFLETTVLTSLVRHKGRYLLGNWLNLVIILGGLPIIWNVTPLTGILRSLRLLLLLNFIVRFSKTLREVLALNRLGATLLVSFVVIILSGLVISGIDPAIKSPIDGIWWAWVTVTTVGYGDLVPSSGAGKVFAAILILLGIALFSLLTANFSAYFIGADVEKVARTERALKKEVEEIEADIERDVSHLEKEEDAVLVALNDIQRRLERIETRIDRFESSRDNEE